MSSFQFYDSGCANDPSNFSNQSLLKTKKVLKTIQSNKALLKRRYHSTPDFKEVSEIRLIKNYNKNKSMQTKNISKVKDLRFLYNKIFQNYSRPKRKKEINFEGNIIRNEYEFVNKMKEREIELTKKGKMYGQPRSTLIKQLLDNINTIKTKINFIEGVSNYTFPIITTDRIKHDITVLKNIKKLKNPMNLLPYQKVDYVKKLDEKVIHNSLKKSFCIYHY